MLIRQRLDTSSSHGRSREIGLAQKFATTTRPQRADIAEDVGIPTEIELIPPIDDDRMQGELQGIVGLPVTLRENASSLAMSAMSIPRGFAVCTDVACGNLRGHCRWVLRPCGRARTFLALQWYQSLIRERMVIGSVFDAVKITGGRFYDAERVMGPCS